MGETKDEAAELQEAMEAGKESVVFARVKVPTQGDIEEALLRRKKQELLEMYAIDSSDLDQFAEQMETSETTGAEEAGESGEKQKETDQKETEQKETEQKETEQKETEVEKMEQEV